MGDIVARTAKRITKKLCCFNRHSAAAWQRLANASAVEASTGMHIDRDTS